MESLPPDQLLEIRGAAMRGATVRQSPRDERADRITRTLRRVLQVPVAVLASVEDEQLLFHSIQGLGHRHQASDMVFCGQVVANGAPVIVSDTWVKTGAPVVASSVRSWVGWPLEITPGVVLGVLCGIDTIPRQYSEDEIAGLKDLARIAECELRAHASAVFQQNLLQRLDLAQRRHALDPFTGCWSIRGFRELVGLAVPQAQADHTHMALCQLSVRDVAWVETAGDESARTSVLSVLAQALRERLPVDGALARLDDIEFCAMVPAPSAAALERELAGVLSPQLSAVLADGRRMEATVSGRVIRLSGLGRDATASKLWGAVLRCA
jgi:GGDEF domain-containing protein